MRTILLTAALAALATCDVPHILNQPSPRYGSPASSYGAGQGTVISGLPSGAPLTNVQSLPNFRASLLQAQPQLQPTSRLTLPVKDQISFQSGFSSTLAPDLNLIYSTPAPQLNFESGFGLNNANLGLSNANLGLNNANLDLGSLGGLSGLNFNNGNLNLGGLNFNDQFDTSALLNSGGFGDAGFLGGVTSTISPLVSPNGLPGISSTTIGPLVTPNGLGGLGFVSQQNIETSTEAPLSSGDEDSEESDTSRHLYFFAAPEDDDEPEPRINIPVQPPKKNVKVIFIKAPAYKPPAPVHIPAQPQNQEKTVVYVLVKKQDRNVPVVIEPQTPTAPTKPEVFFIKYQNQQEAEEAISKVQNVHNAQGHVVLGGAPNLIRQGGLGLQSTTVRPAAQLGIGNLQSLGLTNLGSLVRGINPESRTDIDDSSVPVLTVGNVETDSPDVTTFRGVQPTTPTTLTDVEDDNNEDEPSDDDNAIVKTTSDDDEPSANSPVAKYRRPAAKYGPPK